MVEREITHRLTSLFRQYPFVTVTGPRQSGKTTLCRAAFPHLNYSNLEAPDQRAFAESDPRGFIAQLGEGAIIDEVQHVPDLLSYLQVLADEKGGNGLFVLTGSEQFRLSDAISQSLAGRTALLRLLPFSLAERRRIGASGAVDDILYSGFYPRILDQGLDPRQALGDYIETYVERDVRRLGEIRNLSSFRTSCGCAPVESASLSISPHSARTRASPTPRRGSGSRCWRRDLPATAVPREHPKAAGQVSQALLLRRWAGQLSHRHRERGAGGHPSTSRGAVENAVVAEALKHRFNRGLQANLSFFRDARGLECDLFYETGRGIGAIEVKAGSTVSSDYFRSINRVADLIPEVLAKAVVYGGVERQSRSDSEVVPLSGLEGVLGDGMRGVLGVRGREFRGAGQVSLPP